MSLLSVVLVSLVTDAGMSPSGLVHTAALSTHLGHGLTHTPHWTPKQMAVDAHTRACTHTWTDMHM